MLLSNKAILPVLWELFPDCPYLLRAENEPFGKTFIRKPMLAREESYDKTAASLVRKRAAE